MPRLSDDESKMSASRGDQESKYEDRVDIVGSFDDYCDRSDFILLIEKVRKLLNIFQSMLIYFKAC